MQEIQHEFLYREPPASQAAFGQHQHILRADCPGQAFLIKPHRGSQHGRPGTVRFPDIVRKLQAHVPDIKPLPDLAEIHRTGRTARSGILLESRHVPGLAEIQHHILCRESPVRDMLQAEFRQIHLDHDIIQGFRSAEKRSRDRLICYLAILHKPDLVRVQFQYCTELQLLEALAAHNGIGRRQTISRVGVVPVLLLS